jgi:hypothetical protein
MLGNVGQKFLLEGESLEENSRMEGESTILGRERSAN